MSRQGRVSPKRFMAAKNPKTNVRRLVCLGYYVAHVRGRATFEAQEILALNKAVAGKRFDVCRAIRDASKCGLLAPAARGRKRLTKGGRAMALVLPYQDRARVIEKASQLLKENRELGPWTI